jgi:hypothetical protein
VNDINKIYFLFPVFLAFLLVISNLLNANLFVNAEYTFAVWFIFMLAAFVSGWIMNSVFQWNDGIKIISITIAVSIVLSLLFVAIFRHNFDMNNSFMGNLVLYSLRVLVLGLSSLFGFSVSENMKHKTNSENEESIDEIPEVDMSDKAEYYIKEAKLKAEKILFEAEKDAQKIIERKDKIETQLRELINTEREVIRKYELEETSGNKNIETGT